MIDREETSQNTHNCFFSIAPGIILNTEIESWRAFQLGDGGSGSLNDDRAKSRTEHDKDKLHVTSYFFVVVRGWFYKDGTDEPSLL